MRRMVTVLALVMCLAAVSACGADQTSQQNQGAEQTLALEQTVASKTSDEAVKPFAPEVAEESAADYAPNIDPSNFVKDVDDPYFPLEPGTTWVYEGPAKTAGFGK